MRRKRLFLYALATALTCYSGNAFAQTVNKYYDGNYAFSVNADSTQAAITGFNAAATYYGGTFTAPDSVMIPDSVRFLYTTDNAGAVTISYSKKIAVTSIAANAFLSNAAITTVFIPSWVKKIDENAFNGCTKLNEVKFQSFTLPTLGNNSFANTTCKIYVITQSYEKTLPLLTTAGATSAQVSKYGFKTDKTLSLYYTEFAGEGPIDKTDSIARLFKYALTEGYTLLKADRGLNQPYGNATVCAIDMTANTALPEGITHDSFTDPDNGATLNSNALLYFGKNYITSAKQNVVIGDTCANYVVNAGSNYGLTTDFVAPNGATYTGETAYRSLNVVNLPYDIPYSRWSKTVKAYKMTHMHADKVNHPYLQYFEPIGKEDMLANTPYLIRSISEKGSLSVDTFTTAHAAYDLSLTRSKSTEGNLFIEARRVNESYVGTTYYQFSSADSAWIKSNKVTAEKPFMYFVQLTATDTVRVFAIDGKCEAPSISRGANIIYMTTPTEGANIYYTVDGSNPDINVNSKAHLFNNSLNYLKSDYFKAVTTKLDWESSEPTSYYFDVATLAEPMVKIDGNKIANIECATDSVTIIYTTDGTKPTYNNDSDYHGTLVIPEEVATHTFIVSPDIVFIKAIAVKITYPQSVMTIVNVKTNEVQHETTGINTATNSEITGSEIYNASGVQQSTLRKGLNIVRVKMSDGSIKIMKIMKR